MNEQAEALERRGIIITMSKMTPLTSIGRPPVLRAHKQEAVESTGVKVTRVVDRVVMATNHPAAEEAVDFGDEAFLSRPGKEMFKPRLLRLR